MYTYNIRSVVGVYTLVGVVTEWLWSVHSKLECTLRQGKGAVTIAMHAKFYVIPDRPITTHHCICNIWSVCFQMLLYGEARGSSASATGLRVFCADAYGSEYMFLTQTIMGPVRSS